MLIEEVETLGEPLEDPLLLFLVLYGFWVANIVACNGDVLCDLAAQFLALAEKQSTTIPLMVGHRLMATSSHCTGDIVDGRAHYDQALALYDAAKHRSLATRFGHDIRVSILSHRSGAFGMLGYSEAALADLDQALKEAREIGHAASLMYALNMTSITHLFLGNYAAANAQADELVALAEEKGAPLWKVWGRLMQGCVLAETSEVSDAVHQITSGIAALRSTGVTAWLPTWLLYLAKAYADLHQFEDAWRCIDEAIVTVEKTKERWWEAEVNRTAGEITLLSPEPDAAKDGVIGRQLVDS